MSVSDNSKPDVAGLDFTDLDDWVPEPESYLPDDDNYDDFEVNSPVEDDQLDDNADEEAVVDDDFHDDDTQDEDMPDDESNHGEVMPVVSPVLSPYVGEKPSEPVPVHIATNTAVRWKKR